MKKLLVPSERVKSVDLHSTKSWVLSALYDGRLVITDYKSGTQVKSFDVSTNPIRAAKFIERKHWVVSGGDDMKIVVYSYNTSQKATDFDAHQDYIRSIDVHPLKPYVFSSADDLMVKMWDWSNDWKLVRIFEGHTHFIMQVVLNPKNPSMFATASLDSTVRVWNINSSKPSFTLDGHPKGVNSIGFYHGKDKPFLVSASDDCTVKVWDYQTKACVQTLEGHSKNVTFTCFHPRMGYILSGSEDNAVNIWNNQTYVLEERLSLGLGRIWSICCSQRSLRVAIGFDNGTYVLSLGKEIPRVSMDNKGKLMLWKKGEIQQMTIRPKIMEDVSDGEGIMPSSKDIGMSSVSPQYLLHDEKGRYVALCGDGEYIVHKAISFKNQCYGKAVEFVWGKKTGQFAIREKSGKIKVFKNFKENNSFDPEFGVEKIYGGELLGIRSSESIFFHDWESLTFVRNVDIRPNLVFWGESGENLVLAVNDRLFFLKYQKEKVRDELDAGEIGESGIDCFELDFEIPERVKQGKWIGDCFIYINEDRTLKYYISASPTTVALLDKTYYLLGYLSRFNRIFLMDKEYNLISYKLHISVLQYQAFIISNDFEAAEDMFSQIPKECHNSIAQFLCKHPTSDMRLKEKALKITTEPEFMFKLSLELGKIEECIEIAKKSTQNAEEKWRQIGTLCLSLCKYKQAEYCLLNGNDFGGLLLLYSSFAHREGMMKLAEIAKKSGKNNVAFMSNMMLGNLEECVDILVETGRLPEAAFMARSYLPSHVSRVVKEWKNNLSKVNEKAARALADPLEYPDLFPGLDAAWEKEKDRDKKKLLQTEEVEGEEDDDEEEEKKEEEEEEEEKDDIPDQPPVEEPEQEVVEGKEDATVEGEKEGETQKETKVEEESSKKKD